MTSPTPARGLLRPALVVLAVAIVVGACSDESEPASSSAAPVPVSTGSNGSNGSNGSSGSSVPAVSVELLAPAVAAVEAERGGPQQYTEINAQVGLVNLFVALDDGMELAYVYRDGTLEPASSPQAQLPGAVVFDLTDVPLDVAMELPASLAEELPASRLVGLSLGAHGDAGLGWLASLLSAEGGIIDVLLSPTGEIVDAAAR